MLNFELSYQDQPWEAGKYWLSYQFEYILHTPDILVVLHKEFFFSHAFHVIAHIAVDGKSWLDRAAVLFVIWITEQVRDFEWWFRGLGPDYMTFFFLVFHIEMACLLTSQSWHRRCLTFWVHLLILCHAHLRGRRERNPSSLLTPPTRSPSLLLCTSRGWTALWVGWRTNTYKHDNSDFYYCPQVNSVFPFYEGPARLVWGSAFEGQRSNQLHLSDGC